MNNNGPEQEEVSSTTHPSASRNDLLNSLLLGNSHTTTSSSGINDDGLGAAHGNNNHQDPMFPEEEPAEPPPAPPLTTAPTLPPLPSSADRLEAAAAAPGKTTDPSAATTTQSSGPAAAAPLWASPEEEEELPFAASRHHHDNHHTSLAAREEHDNNFPPPNTATTTTTTTTWSSSSSFLLSKSAFLLSRDGGGGGGLFDQVEQEEEAAAAAAAAAAERAAAVERERVAAERERQERQRQQEQEEEAAARAAAQQQQQQQMLMMMMNHHQNQLHQQQQQQQQQTMLQDQMQSIHLGGPTPPPQPYQQPAMAQSMPALPVTMVDPGFYRPQAGLVPGAPPLPGAPTTPAGQPYGSSATMTPAPWTGGPATLSAAAPPPTTTRYYVPEQPGSLTAGMHNGQQQGRTLGRPKPPRLLGTVPPPEIVPLYGKVSITEPLLIQSSSLLGLGQPPHWSYQVTTEVRSPSATNHHNNMAPTARPGWSLGPTSGRLVWQVRRRFRHVVALEERLREECPGAILPPRPDKHATRAIEEASTHQSAEFAVQRAAELEVYLNQLVQHPVVYNSQVLRLFLALQDDLGTAWPEVSANAFTRLANASVGAAVKVTEGTSTAKFPWQDQGLTGIDEYGEEDAELLSMQSSEQNRMGAVLQAVPKLEGAVLLLRELAEQKGAVGMELSRLAKEVEGTDQELAKPMELVSAGMLRSGRRSKRLALELSAALHTYTQQYKLCRYERLAMADRRAALVRRQKERGKADQRAAQLLMQQRSLYQQPPPPSGMGGYGGYGGQQPPQLDRLEREAAVWDELATDSQRECQEIGQRLKSEIHRVAWQRRTEWSASVKVMASALKEASSERVAIWTGVLEQFVQAFPGQAVESLSAGYPTVPPQVPPGAGPSP